MIKLPSNSEWVENYPGIITSDRKLLDFEPLMLETTYSIKKSRKIMENGDNIEKDNNIKKPTVALIKKPTVALTYEDFTNNILKENFLSPNMTSHMNPIWIIIIFLIAIYIIFFLAK